MPRRSASIELTAEHTKELHGWIRAGGTPQQVVLRAKIVRHASEGRSNKQIAADLEVTARTVALWRLRVREEGIHAIWHVADGRGRKPTFGATTVSGWIERTLQTQPAGATHWSTRSLGREVGVNKNTIHRAWQDHQLKSHLTKTFKLSRDPQFVEKLTDVVGVYLQPPKDAVVLCVDEKSQIQALDRSQPGLPLKRGRCGTFTHEYERHGTTCLFAALHVGKGRVIAEHYPRHRHHEFLRFLRRLDAGLQNSNERPSDAESSAVSMSFSAQSTSFLPRGTTNLFPTPGPRASSAFSPKSTDVANASNRLGPAVPNRRVTHVLSPLRIMALI